MPSGRRFRSMTPLIGTWPLRKALGTEPTGENGLEELRHGSRDRLEGADSQSGAETPRGNRRRMGDDGDSSVLPRCGGTWPDVVRLAGWRSVPRLAVGGGPSAVP